MTIRELTDHQRKKLARKMMEELKERNRGRPEATPFEPICYQTGFSDGVRAILNLVDKLP